MLEPSNMSMGRAMQTLKAGKKCQASRQRATEMRVLL